MDTPDNPWTDTDAWQFHEDVLVANDRLINQAAAWGVNLRVELNYINSYVDYPVDMVNYADWAKAALTAANLPTENTIPTLREMYQFEEAAIFFVSNRDGRSFAVNEYAESGLEYVVLYRRQGDYRHELYHVYGAADLYYPQEAKQQALACFGDSIMIDGAAGGVDALTAYLLGWTEQPSFAARTFLENTAWITADYVNSALDSETASGYMTIRWGDGTYTGDVVDGVPQGWGTMVWDSGDWCEGNWVYGTIEGYATFYWASVGDLYQGEFHNNVIHGYGTYTFANGQVLTGQWANNEFVG